MQVFVCPTSSQPIVLIIIVHSHHNKIQLSDITLLTQSSIILIDGELVDTLYRFTNQYI